jgi:hypothetical protein
MGMTQKQKDALTKNWSQAKSQVKSQFGVGDDDLSSSDPDQVVETISNKTGQDRSEVERNLGSIADQYTS